MRELDLTAVAASDVVAKAAVLEDCVAEADLANWAELLLDFSCDTIEAALMAEAEVAEAATIESWMLIEDEDNLRDDFLRLERSSEVLDKYLSCDDALACLWW